MYRIVRKRVLNPTVIAMDIDAPLVAAKAQAGQFIILRVDAEGERIPLTVAGYDRAAGTVRIIFQTVGATTDALGRLNVGDSIQDFVGPLGKPTELEGLTGIGCAWSAAVSAVPLLCPLPRSCIGEAVKSTQSSASAPATCLFWKTNSEPARIVWLS